MKIEESYIYVCRDLDALKSEVLAAYPPLMRRIFTPIEGKDFLLDDAKAIVREAYIAEKDPKAIITIAPGYGREAQNSLLKILEEPPRNISFVLCAPSKTIFLPTIRSRLPIKVLDVPRDRVVAGLNFKTLDVGEIYKFIKERTPQNKDETKALLQAIMTEALAQGVRLSETELEQFRRLLHLAELNSRAQNILLAALLTIINRREKQPK